MGDAFGIATSDVARTRLTRVLVLIVALLALGVWLVGQKTVVELLLLYYNGVTQLMPGVVAAFLWKRATAWGVAAGITIALALAIPLAALNISPWGINAGFLALAVNVAVLAIVSLASRSPSLAPPGA
jgi:SSS family solute:Na+ symporter